MPSVSEIIKLIEGKAPLYYQESYDNSGLQIGKLPQEVKGIILSVDVTEQLIDEAIANNLNLIISHHPLIFGNLKRITGNGYVERIIEKAIKADISIYSCHTNIDNISGGVNFKIAEKLGLSRVKILKPLSGILSKLVTYIPVDHLEQVRNAVFQAGAGFIGNYDCCSFNSTGEGTFRPSKGSNPFVGEIGKLHTEKEIKMETIFPKFLENKIISALIKSHPYEEVAYDIIPLGNKFENAGAGAIGFFEEPMDEKQFLQKVKIVFNVSIIRHTKLLNRKISTVALCGGSGSFLLNDAKKAGAEVFLSADFKYHQFFDSDNEIIIADIGHFESEQFTLDIFYEILIKNFPNFAVHFTKINSNPINYF